MFFIFTFINIKCGAVKALESSTVFHLMWFDKRCHICKAFLGWSWSWTIYIVPSQIYCQLAWIELFRYSQFFSSNYGIICGFFWVISRYGSSIKYLCKVFQKTNISNPLRCTRKRIRGLEKLSVWKILRTYLVDAPLRWSSENQYAAENETSFLARKTKWNTSQSLLFIA